ncbi:hypothetical protein BLNAU_8438 [Blattamonas nauphoetae]|uniref:Uncharacterized protein n=1 Tax=Blattamonas nauphoetae TaxID=2049346 RepID=A0ABQ9XYN3_9EUKA|nr:hypothetical protein BLNAU_8438 [Blattamonas nauphoetae]
MRKEQLVTSSIEETFSNIDAFPVDIQPRLVQYIPLFNKYIHIEPFDAADAAATPLTHSASFIEAKHAWIE